MIDPNSGYFSQHGNIPPQIRKFARDTGQDEPRTMGEMVRTCAESLALSYRHYLECLENIVGYKFDIVHIVGGGAKNSLVNQMTADATGKIVIAGPYEASSIGNLLTQAMGEGSVKGLKGIRKVVRDSFLTETYNPSDKQDAWDRQIKLYRQVSKESVSISTGFPR